MGGVCASVGRPVGQRRPGVLSRTPHDPPRVSRVFCGDVFRGPCGNRKARPAPERAVLCRRNRSALQAPSRSTTQGGARITRSSERAELKETHPCCVPGSPPVACSASSPPQGQVRCGPGPLPTGEHPGPAFRRWGPSGFPASGPRPRQAGSVSLGPEGRTSAFHGSFPPAPACPGPCPLCCPPPPPPTQRGEVLQSLPVAPAYFLRNFPRKCR